MSNVISFVAGGAAVGAPLFDALDETVQAVFADGPRHSLGYAALHNSGGQPASVKLFFTDDEAPVLASSVPDIEITIGAGATITTQLGGQPVSRLWMAATDESGVGDTAPDGPVHGFLVAD